MSPLINTTFLAHKMLKKRNFDKVRRNSPTTVTLYGDSQLLADDEAVLRGIISLWVWYLFARRRLATGVGWETTQATKVDNILQTRKPETKKELRSFLGTIGFYQKFVDNYAKIAKPLTDRLRNGATNVIKDVL